MVDYVKTELINIITYIKDIHEQLSQLGVSNNAIRIKTDYNNKTFNDHHTDNSTDDNRILRVRSHNLLI